MLIQCFYTPVAVLEKRFFEECWNNANQSDESVQKGNKTKITISYKTTGSSFNAVLKHCFITRGIYFFCTVLCVKRTTTSKKALSAKIGNLFVNYITFVNIGIVVCRVYFFFQYKLTHNNFCMMTFHKEFANPTIKKIFKACN